MSDDMVTIEVPRGSVIVTMAAAGEVTKAADIPAQDKE
jgi:hypothetical protein